MVRCMKLMGRFVDYVSLSIITEPMNLFYNEFISDPLDLYRSLVHYTRWLRVPISNYRHVLRNFVIAMRQAEATKRLHLYKYPYERTDA